MNVTAPPRTTSDQHRLRQHIYGDETGLVAVFSGKRAETGEKKLRNTTSAYFEWPGQSSQITRWLQGESQRGREAYQCGHLVKSRRRVKENASLMWACYVDADGAQPGPEHPPPSAIVESSPGHFHFYYRFTRGIDPKVAEQLNRRLANQIQADMSGWDLTQLLRPPDTRNWKYDQRVEVKLVSIDEALTYDPDELDRILPELPDDAKPRAEVKLERSAVAAPIGDRDQRALKKMFDSKRGSDLRTLLNGGSLHKKPDGSPDHSADDQSCMNGLAFWLDKDPARMARAFRSGRDRPKLDEVHSAAGETYLEMTIGTAISGCLQTFRDLRGHDAGDDPPSIGRIQLTKTEQPVSSDQAEATIPGDPATLDEAMIEIRRLRRGLLDRDDRIEMMTGIIADQQAVIAATRTERDQVVDLRAIDRRTEMAKQRIRRAYKPGQADAIIAVAQIAPPIANAHQTDEPIITREMIAETNGSHPSSAGENAKVFDQPGSPIQRTLKTLGTKSLTAYKLDGLSTVDILEKMADLGETLDRAAPTRAKHVRCERCPDGTTQTLAIICDGCNGLLSKRQLPPPPANASETRALEDPPHSVDVLVTSGTRNARVAGHPEVRQPVHIGQIRMTRHQEPPPPTCTRVGCTAPATNGFVCAGHLRGDPLPAMAGAET